MGIDRELPLPPKVPRCCPDDLPYAGAFKTDTLVRCAVCEKWWVKVGRKIGKKYNIPTWKKVRFYNLKYNIRIANETN